MEPKGWHDRGYLPHRDVPLTTQSINFRLHGSLPGSVIAELKGTLRALPESERRRAYLTAVDKYLDEDRDVGHLYLPEVARTVEDCLLEGAGQAFNLHAWCLMPNHVHVLITPHYGKSLGQIVKAWKKVTGPPCNALVGDSGSFWAKDYFDRQIRDERHFWNEVAYIENNPVKAKLCEHKKDWTFSSARWRE